MWLDHLYEFRTLFHIACFFQFCYVCTWFYIWVKPDPSQKINEFRAQFMKIFYYVSVALAEAKLLQGYHWLPTWLGGVDSGNYSSAQYIVEVGAAKMADYYALYYLQIFYHGMSSFVSVLPGNRTKPEMFLHHIVTMGLLVSSLAADRCPEGAIILLLHDTPDIFTSLVKALYALDLKYETFAAYLMLIGTWPTFRLYLLAKFSYSAVMRPEANVVIYCGVMLWTLFGLHCFWYYLFLCMGARFIKSSGKALPKDETQTDYAADVKRAKAAQEKKRKEKMESAAAKNGEYVAPLGTRSSPRIRKSRS